MVMKVKKEDVHASVLRIFFRCALIKFVLKVLLVTQLKTNKKRKTQLLFVFCFLVVFFAVLRTAAFRCE